MGEETKQGTQGSGMEPKQGTPAGEPQGEPQGEPKEPTTLEDALALLNETRAALKTVNAESATRRRELKKLNDEAEALRKKEQEASDAEKSELQRAQDEIAKLKSEHAKAQQQLNRVAQQRLFEATVKTQKLEFVNDKAADDAFVLAELGDATEADEVSAAIAKLKTERPYLFRAAGTTAPPDAGSQNRNNNSASSAEERRKAEREKMDATGKYGRW